MKTKKTMKRKTVKEPGWKNQKEKPEGDVLKNLDEKPCWDMRIFEEQENYEDETLRRGKLLRNQYEKLGDVLRNHADNPWWETWWDMRSFDEEQEKYED